MGSSSERREKASSYFRNLKKKNPSQYRKWENRIGSIKPNNSNKRFLKNAFTPSNRHNQARQLSGSMSYGSYRSPMKKRASVKSPSKKKPKPSMSKQKHDPNNHC